MTKYVYEEKTAPSAPICSFEDGVDGISTKSMPITIKPTLSGVSTITETQTVDSVFLPMDIEQGSINSSGNNVNSTTRLRTIDRKAVTPSTEYKIKVNSEVQIYEVHEYTDLEGSSTHLTVNASEYTFTTQSTTNYLRILFRYSNNATILPSAITSLQVTDDWETYTAQLGRTVYGGTADIVNGIGTGAYGIYTVTSASDIGRNDGQRYYIIQSKTGAKIPSTNEASVISDKLPSGLPSGAYHNLVWLNPTGAIRWDTDTNYSTTADMLADFGGSITFVYPLATPTNFTFEGQEIPTKQGYNAFWSDSGDTEVTYYIQIPVEERYVIGGEILSDIADAIREKKESTAPILTEDMADEIRSIEMGGSDLFDLASQSTFDLTDATYKTHALTIPDRMFNNNQRIRTVNISGIKTIESYAFIQCKATSLSFPDVETIGYQAFFQCRGASDVPLSIPNVVTIGEEAFKEAYVCGESTSYRFLDISKCKSIGHNAFRSTRINGFKMDSVETLGNNPWFGGWFSMTTVLFPKLKTAGSQMCRGITFTNLVIGPDWESCGGGFAGYDMDWRNKYVYVYAVVPPTMGGDFSLWKPPVAFYVPADSVDAYKAAPYWSQYASIILPLPSDHLTIDTWL